MAGKLSNIAGIFNAFDFAYGINPRVPALLCVNGSPTAASSSGTITVAVPTVNLSDGTILSPLSTNAPVTVGSDSGIDVSVTPSAVSVTLGSPAPYGQSSFTASFTYAHGNGDEIRSATAGLQEALNYASTKGGGLVVIDAAWTAAGGTQAMVASATFPANVGLWDNRFGIDYGSFTYTLTNAQVIAMETTPVFLLPAPGANSYWQVNSANLININAGTAFTSGGVITIGYGTNQTTIAANTAVSGTVAASFLTTPTATEVIQVGSGLTSATAGTLVLNKPVGITNGTGVFAGGTGASLQVVLQVANITT